MEIKNKKSIIWTCIVVFFNLNQGSKSHQKECLEMSPYLKSNIYHVPIKTARFIAKVQSYMVENIKHNLKKKYKPNFDCNSCNLGEFDQKHLLECTMLIGINKLVFIPSKQHWHFLWQWHQRAWVYSQSYDGDYENKKVLEGLKWKLLSPCAPTV